MPSSRNPAQRATTGQGVASPARTRQSRLIAAACRLIEGSEQPPNLTALATQAGLSRFHFHRLFKEITGITPKAYVQAHRARRAQSELAGGISVTEAIHAAGYGSSSRFYAGAPQSLGMPARAYRTGGKGEVIRFAVAQCRLGALLVAASTTGVCAILLGDDPAALVQDVQRRFGNAQLVGADPRFERWIAQVIGFIEAPGTGLELPLDLRGSVFQQRVWHALRRIPVGETLSYAELARRIGVPGGARAVAQACAANPLALAVPCHRVVRTDGSLSGYRWGVARKQALLERERRFGDRLGCGAASAQPPEKSKSMSSGTGTS
jgi:AraC family transcriptional regulator of adaptative response/methylated-DNA-[protein]-cysteine methyltransferase